MFGKGEPLRRVEGLLPRAGALHNAKKVVPALRLPSLVESLFKLLPSSSRLFMSSASLSWFSHPSHADMMLDSILISRPPSAACRPKPTDYSLPVATLLLGPMFPTVVSHSTPPRLARSGVQAKIRPYRTATFCRDMIDIAQTTENK